MHDAALQKNSLPVQFLDEHWDTVTQVVDCQVREFLRRHPHLIHLRDDMIGEIHVALTEKQAGYRPESGALATYVRVICESALSDFLRQHRAVRRGRQITRSASQLETRSRGDDGLDLLQRLECHHVVPEAQVSDLRMDLDQVLDELSPLQRQLASQLTQASRESVRKALKWSKRRMRRQVHQILKVFERADLQHYL